MIFRMPISIEMGWLEVLSPMSKEFGNRSSSSVRVYEELEVVGGERAVFKKGAHQLQVGLESQQRGLRVRKLGRPQQSAPVGEADKP